MHPAPTHHAIVTPRRRVVRYPSFLNAHLEQARGAQGAATQRVTMTKHRLMTTVMTVLALGGTAAAAPPAPSAEDLYAEGQAAYDRADYPTAIERWQAAYDLSGASGLLFNLAQALRLSGECPRALATYRKFIATDDEPTSEQHKLAEDLAREQAAKCDEPLPVPTHGVHTDPGGSSPVPLPTGPEGPSTVSSGSALRVAGLATGGAGLALLVTGLVVGHHASTLGDEVTHACTTSCDWAAQAGKDSSGRSDATVGYVLDGIGVAAIAGGALMYYLGERGHSIDVAATSRADGAVVSWSTSW